jgi:hypothetical protein
MWTVEVCNGCHGRIHAAARRLGVSVLRGTMVVL